MRILHAEGKEDVLLHVVREIHAADPCHDLRQEPEPLRRIVPRRACLVLQGAGQQGAEEVFPVGGSADEVFLVRLEARPGSALRPEVWVRRWKIVICRCISVSNSSMMEATGWCRWIFPASRSWSIAVVVKTFVTEAMSRMESGRKSGDPLSGVSLPMDAWAKTLPPRESR